MNKKKLIEAFEKHNPRTPMTEDETKIMMTLMMSKDIQFSTPIAELNAKKEDENRKAKIFIGQGEAEAARLKVKAGLTPQERVEWNYKTQVGIAAEFAKAKPGAFVPNIMVIGSSGGSSVNPMDAVGLNMLMDVQAKMNSNTNIPKK